MKLTKSYSYTNDRETRTFTVRVGVSMDLQFYFARDQIPAEILERTNALLPKRSYADSWYELDRIITDLIEKYEAGFIEETREQVIAYRFFKDDVGRAETPRSCPVTYRLSVLTVTAWAVGFMAKAGVLRDFNWRFI